MTSSAFLQDSVVRYRDQCYNLHNFVEESFSCWEMEEIYWGTNGYNGESVSWIAYVLLILAGSSYYLILIMFKESLCTDLRRSNMADQWFDSVFILTIWTLLGLHLVPFHCGSQENFIIIFGIKKRKMAENTPKCRWNIDFLLTIIGIIVESNKILLYHSIYWLKHIQIEVRYIWIVCQWSHSSVDQSIGFTSWRLCVRVVFG